MPLKLQRLKYLSVKIKLLGFFSTICFILLFFGGPDYYSSRSYKYSWDFGHLIFFAAWTNLLLLSNQKLSNQNFVQQCIWVLFLSLMAGIATELAQNFFGRTSSKNDLVTDIVGSLTTLFYFSSARKSLEKKLLFSFQIIVALLILLKITPLAIALTDEAIAREQFPILSDFETVFEENRWIADNTISRSEIISSSGEFALKVLLTTEKYSGVFLKYFPSNWYGYKILKFSVYNESFQNFDIHCRIHDWNHIMNGENYSDRFNEKYMLNHGWNTFVIQLDQIINAPKNRKMDIRNIRSFGLFVIQLSEPRVIYIDDIKITM